MSQLESSLFHTIKSLIEASRERVFRLANSTLLMTYWQIGQLIVEDEQQGKQRAEYGKYTLKNLSKQLTLVPKLRDGKGFDYTNLSNMRKFYLTFPIVDALRQQLSWTPYRILFKLDKTEKIDYYIKESIENNWNYRDLKRQINSLTYERVLRHQIPLTEQKPDIQSVLKDPYIFEFLGLNPLEKTQKRI